MAWVKENIANRNDVFGVIVAESITDKLLQSQKVIPNLHLFEYEMSFRLKQARSQ
jgi:hypothetical protein